MLRACECWLPSPPLQDITLGNECGALIRNISVDARGGVSVVRLCVVLSCCKTRTLC